LDALRLAGLILGGFLGGRFRSIKVGIFDLGFRRVGRCVLLRLNVGRNLVTQCVVSTIWPG
jgi:hypothetical protein